MLVLIVICVVAIYAVPTAIALWFARKWPWYVGVSLLALAATALTFPFGPMPIGHCQYGSCDGAIIANIFLDFIRPWLWATMIALVVGRGIILARAKRA